MKKIVRIARFGTNNKCGMCQRCEGQVELRANNWGHVDVLRYNVVDIVEGHKDVLVQMDYYYLLPLWGDGVAGSYGSY